MSTAVVYQHVNEMFKDANQMHLASPTAKTIQSSFLYNFADNLLQHVPLVTDLSCRITCRITSRLPGQCVEALLEAIAVCTSCDATHANTICFCFLFLKLRMRLFVV